MPTASSILTTRLHSRKDIVVLAKKATAGLLTPVTYTNNTQASEKAAELGDGWAVYRGIGRPLFVGRKVRMWTTSDNEAACKQGWAIFNADTHPEIQRLDEGAVFASDDDASAFVRKRAPNCPICAKALEFLGSAA